MRGNILGIFFNILSAVLIIMIVLGYQASDRTEPEFRFSTVSTIYDSKTEEKDLLEGVNAYDAKDGDVSSRIVVEKVVINKDAGTAVVYYAVADLSGNVSKQSRLFPADIADLEGKEEEVLEEEQEGMFSNMLEADDSQEADAESSAEGSSTEANP